MDDFTVDVGETEIATSVAVCESQMIDFHQMENGGVKIVHVDFVFDGVVTVFVGCTIGHPTPYAALPTRSSAETPLLKSSRSKLERNPNS